MSRKPAVVSVSANSSHALSKPLVDSIVLLKGLGVEQDAHLGKTVKHRSRVRKDPTQPNLRQVHLMHTELFDELLNQGFRVSPGDLGENISTRGIELLDLPTHTRLQFARGPIVEVTGLRNPCAQIEQFREGLLEAVLDRDHQGELIRKAGIMSIVIKGGEIRPGDMIDVVLPTGTRARLVPV